MPAGPRIRSNSEFGLITDAPLTAGATSFNSARLALMPVVSSAHAVVTLDPRAINGEPEIVIITAHSAAATVATITRAAYGTVARSHPVGTEWIHAPVDEDFIEVLTSVTRPTDPYEGQLIYETDTDVLRGYNGSAWGTTYLDPPACTATRRSNLSLNNGSATIITLPTEDYDTNSMHDLVTNNDRITFNVAGIYSIKFTAQVDNAPHAPELVEARIAFLGAQNIAGATGDHDRTDSTVWVSCSTDFKVAVGDWVRAIMVQTNSSGGAKNLTFAAFSACWIGKG